MKKKAGLYIIAVLVLVAAGFVGLTYQAEINTFVSNIEIVVPGCAASDDVEFASRDLYCLPRPGADNSEAITVIKTGEPLEFTGVEQGDWVEVISPRYQPTCWILK